MNAAFHANCKRSQCANSIPASLMSEQLCLDHFLDEALLRTGDTLGRCHEGRPLDQSDLEWLLTDALAVVNNLEEHADSANPEQRDRMLELLLIVANLHELAP